MKRHYQKKLLLAMAATTLILVLAAVGAQQTTPHKTVCDLDAPFVCDSISFEESTLYLTLHAYSPESEVRISLLSEYCTPAETFFASLGAKPVIASFDCENIPPTLAAELTVLRQTAQGRTVSGGHINVE